MTTKFKRPEVNSENIFTLCVADYLMEYYAVSENKQAPHGQLELEEADIQNTVSERELNSIAFGALPPEYLEAVSSEMYIDWRLLSRVLSSEAGIDWRIKEKGYYGDTIVLFKINNTKCKGITMIDGEIFNK